MHYIKTIFFITITIALAVALEAVTLSSVQKLNDINTNFQTLSSSYQDYDQGVTLSQIMYNESSQDGLMDLILNQEAKTFRTVSYKKFIQEFYEARGYIPMWFNNKGVRTGVLHDLFKTIRQDPTLDDKGRIRKEYHRLKKKISQMKERDMDKELNIDIRLSSLYRSYLSHHLYGSIKWRNFQNYLASLKRKKMAGDWVTYTPRYNVTDLILKYRLSDIIAMTTPSSFKYRPLLKELKKLRRIEAQGGWKKIPYSSQLRLGRSGNAVKQLTKRLQSEGDYTCRHRGNKYTYDNCLKKAIKHFQKRHGLSQTGKVSKYTRKKLNLSVQWKINKLLLNLDRIKRLPDQAEDRYVMVNIPDFRLYYREKNRQKLTMRVVVGDKKHHTPVFSDKISFIVLNPYWMIPDSIVKKEIIPKMLKNPKYLEERGYEVRTSYALHRPPLDTSKINWSKVLKNKKTKKYKFMQPPGPKNALGKIKFKFPNQFAVYLHDTPAKKYFKKSRRAFSHGCIRIAQPRSFLATFAPHERSVNYRRAKKILKGKKKTQLNLSKPVPVHIVYLTAWVKSDGLVHYISDIYNYDSKQRRALN